LRIAVSGQPFNTALRAAVKAALERLLGLRIDMAEFDQFAVQDRRLRQLVYRFRGMKPPRFATVFESAINAIACQQVTLTLGIHLLNRLTAAYGVSMSNNGETMHAFPRPIDLAGVAPAKLREMGFSFQKGRAITELAQSAAEGRLDLESFAPLSDEEAMKRLLELRGLGRWSAEYILLRGLGRTHVFPGDDVGARKNLQRWLQLDKPLDYQGVRHVLSEWQRFGGLVYFHLLLDRLAEAGKINETRAEANDA
jgi:DNA-3-methyladenine glycosylase II